jgi:hypothetical protein
MTTLPVSGGRSPIILSVDVQGSLHERFLTGPCLAGTCVAKYRDGARK